MHNDLTAQVIRARNGDQQAWNDLVRAVRPADLVYLPQIPTGPGRY